LRRWLGLDGLLRWSGLDGLLHWCRLDGLGRWLRLDELLRGLRLDGLRLLDGLRRCCGRSLSGASIGIANESSSGRRINGSVGIS